MSFDVDRGEVVGIVGESGSGKTMTALSLLRLVPEPGIVSGRILYGEQDVLQMADDEIREFRGNEVAMIFQDPMTSLNPVLRVGFQIEEAMDAHKRFTKQQARERVVPMLQRVRIPASKDRVKDFPHQFSGGMRQRAMIAMGVSNEPSLLIADEPTTALDVTIQAQIIELMKELQERIGMAVLFITHNLGIAAEIADRITVMYAGRIVEEGPAEAIFETPRMPYTMGLLRSVPRLGLERRAGGLDAIPGNVPSPLDLPKGCAFHPRCGFFVAGLCDTAVPPLEECGSGHLVRCVRWREVAAEAAQ